MCVQLSLIFSFPLTRSVHVFSGELQTGEHVIIQFELAECQDGQAPDRSDDFAVIQGGLIFSLIIDS